MDLREKVVRALSDYFAVEYARLEEDDGITGFVVSPKFRNMSSLDRQYLIEEALRKSSARISPEEQRQVLMIAGLTPDEYKTVGARIRVHKVKPPAGQGWVKILLHGGSSDAEFVREVLKKQQGVETREPKPEPDAVGILMSFLARSTSTTPLTKDRTIQILKDDPYIEVMPDA